MTRATPGELRDRIRRLDRRTRRRTDSVILVLGRARDACAEAKMCAHELDLEGMPRDGGLECYGFPDSRVCRQGAGRPSCDRDSVTSVQSDTGWR